VPALPERDVTSEALTTMPALCLLLAGVGTLAAGARSFGGRG
jgi:hypothetical protein